MVHANEKDSYINSEKGAGLMLVILATWEAEMGRIFVQDQTRQIEILPSPK
jgi:hypothetical protein